MKNIAGRTNRAAFYDQCGRDSLWGNCHHTGERKAVNCRVGLSLRLMLISFIKKIVINLPLIHITHE
jgi:hypothetical protein